MSAGAWLMSAFALVLWLVILVNLITGGGVWPR
jgi:hypothetical protein